MTTDKTHGPRFDAARAVSLSDDFAPWAARPGVHLYLRPLGLADAAPGALPLAGGPLAFDRVELIVRGAEKTESKDGVGSDCVSAVADLPTLRRWAGDTVSAPRSTTGSTGSAAHGRPSPGSISTGRG